MTNKEIIQKYLEDQCKIDSALAEKYDSKKVPELMKAIMNKARKIAVGNAAMVKSETVFKWARDFFIDGEFEAKASDNEITEESDLAKNNGVTTTKDATHSEADVEERIRTARIQAKAEALKQFREEAKRLAEAARIKKAEEKAAKEAEKAATAAKLTEEQSNIISLF